jgi:hypothetical protein
MLEMLLNFERSAGFLDHTVLLSVGIIAVAAGIAMWLTGMALRRFFLFVVCAVVGAIIGLHLVGKKTTSAIGLAALFGIVAVFLNRFFITILAAALAVVIAAAVMAWNYDGFLSIGPVTQNMSVTLNSDRTTEFCCRNIVDLACRVEDVCRQMPPFNWLLFPVLIVIFIGGGLFFWNFVCAWLWATAGAILIFTGMVSLLLYKGSTPVTYIFHNGPYFVTVFLAMMILGTIVQLLLFHHIKTDGMREQPKTDKSQAKQQGWRGL